MFKAFWQRILTWFGASQESETPPSPSTEATQDTELADSAPIEDASDLGSVMVIEEIKSEGFNARGLSSNTGWLNAEEMVSINQVRYLWCLDNGHGRLQSGKRSPFFEDGTRLEEWSFNRDIVNRIAVQLDALGVQYIKIVPEDEVGSFLQERVERANQIQSPLGLPKIFVSVHANAMGFSDWDDRFHGLETWFHPNSQSGLHIASVFQSALTQKLPAWQDRGIKHHQSGSRKIFYVLGNTNMPAILTENGFYTHTEEARRLMQTDVRQAIADAHIAAILHIEQHDFSDAPPYPIRKVIG